MPRFKLNDDIELYYEIFGPELGQPDVQTMFFAHGGPGFVDGRSYHDFWAQFASDKTRVIFPDQRGSGRSDDPADISTLNIEQHAKDMHALCKHLGIENPIVAGVSQGGYVAISYAAQFPNEIARLIICNSEAKRETEERVKACRHSLEAFFGLSAEEAEDLSEKIRIFDEHWDWEHTLNYLEVFIPKKVNHLRQHHTKSHGINLWEKNLAYSTYDQHYAKSSAQHYTWQENSTAYTHQNVLKKQKI